MASPNPTLPHHQSHGSFTSLYADVTVPGGSVVLLICTMCHFIEAFCNHSQNSWNESETQLTCNFCGIDGT